jgi:hypothetical protein
VKTELLVVCHPEDLVLEFLSVLDSPAPLRAAIAATSTVLDLPPVGLPRRLALVAGALVPPAAALTRDGVAALIAGALTGGPVWTHSPADDRPERADVARWTTRAAQRARCSVGVSSALKFVADTTVGLTPLQVSRKLDWLATNLPGQAREIGVAEVAEVERYLFVDAGQAARLHDLRHALPVRAPGHALPRFELVVDGLAFQRRPAAVS